RREAAGRPARVPPRAAVAHHDQPRQPRGDRGVPRAAPPLRPQTGAGAPLPPGAHARGGPGRAHPARGARADRPQPRPARGLSPRALARSGALERLERAGVDVISYVQVDNPLVACVDPAFVGFHLLRGSEMSSRAVLKTSARERVGVFCERGGTLAVVEYSDLPDELAALADPAGRLVYRLGRIPVHPLSTSFARRTAECAAGAPPLPPAPQALPPRA